MKVQFKYQQVAQLLINSQLFEQIIKVPTYSYYEKTKYSFDNIWKRMDHFILYWPIHNLILNNLWHLLIAIILMQKIHKVVVIGAGISGIAASLELTKNGIEHIIIEARDRVGGRITSKTFEGIEIQLGASYIHKPHINNRIAKIAKEKGFSSKNIEFLGADFYSQGEDEEACKKYAEITFQVYEELNEEYKKIAHNSPTDISITEAAKAFVAKAEEEKRSDLNVIKFNVMIAGNMAGTESSQLSARQYEMFQSEEDYLPKGGFSNLFKEIFKDVKAEVKLNQKVSKICYSQDIVRIYTNDNIYLAHKVISSLPLGVMQSNSVQFEPKIPESHQKIIQKIGNGNANKVFISFEKPFWDTKMSWIYFLAKDQYNKYPITASIIQDERFILCFFLSGDVNHLVADLSDKEIVQDILKYLGKFSFKEEIRVRAYEVTRWHRDPLSQGSYSFFKVGLTMEDVNNLRAPIDNKIWFVGEHCRPEDISCTHAAFDTGVWAAEEIIKKLK